MNLPQFSWIAVSGIDAEDFFQSQCTGDVKSIRAGESLFTGYCQAQGRLLATFLLARLSNSTESTTEESWALIVPSIQAPSFVKRLNMYVLRRKVKITLTTRSVKRLSSTVPLSDPSIAASFIDGDSQWISHEASLPFQEKNVLPGALHTTEDIAHRRVWIHPNTHEQLVPQMIDLDRIGGVSFNKGCYPGQEIVARMHYLGKPKRGLYAMSLVARSSLADVGDSALLGATVVNSADPTTSKELGILVGINPEQTHALAVLNHDNAMSAREIRAGDLVIDIASIQAANPQ
jgi:folate-binding protein YgfZ